MVASHCGTSRSFLDLDALIAQSTVVMRVDSSVSHFESFFDLQRFLIENLDSRCIRPDKPGKAYFHYDKEVIEPIYPQFGSNQTKEDMEIKRVRAYLFPTVFVRRIRCSEPLLRC